MNISAKVDNTTLKRQLLENYLKQQQASDKKYEPSIISNNDNNDTLVVYDPPENMGIEEFKAYLKKWTELDTFIKKARDIIKEKKKQQVKLSEIITKFMIKNDIEDITSKNFKIKCKVNQVKKPVTQKVLKERITDYFQNNQSESKELIKKVFDDRQVVEKVSLRSLKIS